MEIGRELLLSGSILLEGLTDGLKPEFKNSTIINPPNSITEWYQIAKQFVEVSTPQVSNQ